MRGVNLPCCYSECEGERERERRSSGTRCRTLSGTLAPLVKERPGLDTRQHETHAPVVVACELVALLQQAAVELERSRARARCRRHDGGHVEKFGQLIEEEGIEVSPTANRKRVWMLESFKLGQTARLRLEWVRTMNWGSRLQDSTALPNPAAK